MIRRSPLLALLLAAVLALGIVACSSDGGDGGGGDDAAGESADSGGGSCPDTAFEGDLARETDPSNPEHEPVTLTGDDIVSGLAVPAGSSHTIYLATFELDPAEVGTTLVAPEGEVLVTMNVATDGSADATNVFLTIDSGAGAISSGVVTPDVAVDVLDVSDDQVCLSATINKDYETLDGTVSVPVAQT